MPDPSVPPPAAPGSDPLAPDEPPPGHDPGAGAAPPWPDLDRPAGAGSRWAPVLDDLRDRLRLDARVLVWLAGAALAVAVGAWLLRPAPAPVEETIPRAEPSAEGGAPPAEAPAPPDGEGSGAAPDGGEGDGALEPIVAHAAGAVARPGVYELAPTARVDDLVRAAGGLAPDADGSRVNLAAPLADGSRIYVPRQGEDEVPAPVTADGGAPGPDGGPAGSGGAEATPDLVDLNTADEARLEGLPGVGPATAAAIVAHRDEHGPFATVDDLIDVRGIGEAKLEQIRPLARV